MEPGPYHALINELASEKYDLRENFFNLKVSPVCRHLVAAPPKQQVEFILAAIDWLLTVSPKPTFVEAGVMIPRDVVRYAVNGILKRRLPLTHDELNAVLHWYLHEQDIWNVPEIIKLIEDFLIENKMTFSIQKKIERLLPLIKPY